MKETEKFAAKIGELKIMGIKTLSKEEVLKNPELMGLGENRGIPFSFIEGEVISFPENPVYWVRTFTLRGTTYKMLMCLAESDMRGVLEIPASIFCRVPSLQEERDTLYTPENALGKLLSDQMPDIKRFDILHSRKTVKVVRKISLHQDSFKVDEAGIRHRIADSVDLPERRTLICYMFN